MKSQFTSSGLTRRSLLATGAAVLATPMLSRRAFAAPTELTMLAWYGHAEPDIVAEFEAENNVKFVPKYYTGGDNMLGLISQSPPGTFDIILSDAEYVQALNAAGYVEELDPNDYAIDDYFPEFQQFPGNWADGKLFSLVTRFGFLGVAYNTDALTEAEASTYNVFWDPKLTGKVGHFDWHLPNLGQMSLLNGNVVPYDIDEAAWEAVKAKTMTLRPQTEFDVGAPGAPQRRMLKPSVVRSRVSSGAAEPCTTMPPQLRYSTSRWSTDRAALLLKRRKRVPLPALRQSWMSAAAMALYWPNCSSERPIPPAWCSTCRMHAPGPKRCLRLKA